MAQLRVKIEGPHTMKPMVLIAAAAITGTSLASIIPTRATTVRSDRVARTSSVRDLKELLKTGLRPRTPAEFAFVDRVVKMTQQNKLPLPLVKASFNWARRKRPYPFPYFQRAVKILAARRGIVVR